MTTEADRDRPGSARWLSKEAALRRIRWFAAVFTFAQVLLYKAPTGSTVPFDQLRVGIALASCVAAVNLISLIAFRAGRPGGAWIHFPVAADAVIVMVLVWLFAFDPSSALWALLVIPVLEASYLGRLRGAVALWAVGAVGYTAREVWAASAYGLPVMPESISYRMGIVLIVALAAGFMARDLSREVRGHDEARAESEKRASMLRLVASSGRMVGAESDEELLAGVIDAAMQCGFEAAQICVYDVPSGTWTPSHTEGLAEPRLSEPRPIGVGLAGQVRATGARVVVDNYSDWESAQSEARSLGLRTVIGSPIWAGGELAAVLIVGTSVASTPDPNALEALELLAQHAGVAIRNRRFMEALRHQSLHDALTGLPNQVLFEDRVNQALLRRRRGGPPVAVGVVDLDNFKRINDSLGHAAGNELIRQVADRLRLIVAGEDTVARLGGDEFTILLTGRAEPDDVRAFGGRLLKALRDPFVLEGEAVFLTASIGFANCPRDGQNFQVLLRNSDVAMYRAKRSGRNAVVLYGGEEEGARRGARLTLEAELHRAVAAEELEVVYQPLVSLPSRRLSGVEALVRWRHPTRGYLQPADFLPLAEEIGLMATIDAHVLMTACRQAQAWVEVGIGPIPVSVNVSSQLLADERFFTWVTEALTETGLDPHLLDLEISEQIASVEMTEARQLIDRLRAMGVQISIDDFGTGWSALGRMNQLRADRLKIDRSFVAECRNQGRSPVIAAALALAHEFGLQVVAEGVEFSDQLGLLTAFGCDLVQGHFLSPPVSPLAIPALVAGPLGEAVAA